MKVLVLAGTREARELIELLAAEPGVEVVASLAGRTSSRVELPCPVRVGGFGGVDGLRRFLRSERVGAVVDATHPFAARMPHHALAAARGTGIPHLRLRRPPYQHRPGDRWVEVDDMAAAAVALRRLDARRVLLTVGRLDLEPFSTVPGVHFVVRSVEPPAQGPPGATIVTARGPFTVDGERALLAGHDIDALVTKDSGGDDAKIRAARAAGIAVAMVRRPPDVDATIATDASAAQAWVRALTPPAPGPHGGDAAALAAWLGTDLDAVLDLSVSLNPDAPDAARLVARAATRVGHYPDPRQPTRALAGAIGVDPGRLVLTNGGAEAIALVAAHEPVGWVEDPEFSLYARHLAEVREGAPRWRSNPSNPLGRLAPGSAEAAVWDEAFYPLASGTWTRGDDRAWRVGSLTKLWACPGLRLGYVIAPTLELAEAIRSRQPRWAVNALALAVVEPLLAETDLAGWAAAIRPRRIQLVQALMARGFAVRDTDACWVLVEAPGLRDLLARRAVLVRDCTSFGMPGVVRMAVPDDAGLDRLLTAVDGVLGDPGGAP
ncbi:MAG TPA: cobalt-precorrin-6A reductase [Acidimicrobiales bacterium]|nr:cobalt-precorrin-6A reductase [Acidimicrobiales bacterium]